MERTPFFSIHEELGAKMVNFANWLMPLHYGSIREEHLWTRKHASLFDVSHMGRIFVEGKDAQNFLNLVVSTDVSKMEVGDARYGLVLNERGGIVDDVVIYKFSEESFMIVVNASNRKKDLDFLNAYKGNFHVELEDRTKRIAQVALQGPEAINIAKELLGNVDELYFYTWGNFGKFMVSRTGYTGEDGIEIYSEPDELLELVRKLMDDDRVRWAGLGARDSLRLEAGYCLYGNDIDETTDPISARLKWTLDMDKDFVGKQAILKILEEKPKKVRVGFKALEKIIPRKGDSISDGEKNVGYITSGTFSPILQTGIAMGYVSKKYSKPGNILYVKGKKVEVRKFPLVEGSVGNAPRKQVL